MMKKLLVFFALLLASPAFAQTVQQSGTVTARHPMYWVTSGVAGDPGGATDSAISGLGVTNEGGPGLCVSSQRASAAGRQQLCLSTGTSTGATITLTNLGTAPSAPLNFVVDGTTYPFPGSLANITIGVTPVIGGTTSNCLFVSGSVVGQQACTLSAITSLIGDGDGNRPRRFDLYICGLRRYPRHLWVVNDSSCHYRGRQGSDYVGHNHDAGHHGRKHGGYFRRYERFALRQRQRVG